MAAIVFLGISVISLFFSFIFATQIYRRKEWPNSYLCASLFFYSLTSLCLSLGHLFAWYTWTAKLYSLTYTLIFPLLLGVGIYHLVHKLRPALAWQVSLGYVSLLFILVLSLLTQPDPLAGWSIYLTTSMFMLTSMWLWLNREGESWLWFAISGVLALSLEFFSSKAWLGMTMFSILWLVIFACLWKALSSDFPLDLTYENRRREELSQGGDVSWKEV